MKQTYLFILSLLMIFTTVSCTENDTPLYSFFIAGHTYGNPKQTQYGLYPPFVSLFPYLNSYKNMELGFLTGDVVAHGTDAYWNAAKKDIEKLNMPIHISPGNHDFNNYDKHYGSYYKSFIHKNSLFIILTPNLNLWHIRDEQMKFLKGTLKDNAENVQNIFILMHELIWWTPDNEYTNITINYPPVYHGPTNFHADVKPLLLSYPNPITIFAGDLGANKKATSCMYHHFDNITLIASGMGDGKRDHFIIADVYTDTTIYKIKALNETSAISRNILDYSLEEINEH